MSQLLDLLPASTPAWSRADPDSSVGVDFLGTRQANLDMLSQLTGVYNNQIRSARQHAILTWAAWRFLQNAQGRDEVTKAEFEAFLDVVETIQLVGQQEVGVEMGGQTGGLGSGSYPGLPEEELLPTRFEEYKRTHETSALAAVQYGPSAKADGLGFLTTPHGIPVPTHDRGLPLAQALDELLQRSPAYPLLTHLPAPQKMKRSEMCDLARHGLVIAGRDGPPRPERDCYIDAVFGLDGRPARDDRGHTMALILEWVQRLNEREGVSAHVVRVQMLAWRPKQELLPAHLDEVAHRWQVFQVRQLQRFALESWLGIAELWMQARVPDIHKMLEEIDVALLGSDLAASWRAPTGAVLARYADPLGWAADRAPWALVWDSLAPAFKKQDRPAAIVAALELLLGAMALFEQTVPAQGPLAVYAATGGRTRLSMATLAKWWHRRAAWPLRDVIGELIEELVLQQHVAIAVSRYDNQKRRLRFSMGERGWELLPSTVPSTPGLTPDRLVAATALLDDLALLRVVGGSPTEPSFEITAGGEAVLARFEAMHAGG